MYRVIVFLLIAVPAFGGRRSTIRDQGRPRAGARRESVPLRPFQPIADGEADDPSSSIEVAFSPNGGATELIVRVLDEAESTIRLAAYGFTSRPIALALLAAQQRGVDVRAVVDKSNAFDRYTVAVLLANHGVPVRVDYRYGIMHMKALVIDGKTVETGSFNFTAAAESKNAENVLVIRDNPELAHHYLTEWKRLWEESQDMNPRVGNSR